uniref:N-acetyltransferase domain-containing protein n=1 Tax=Corethron hystrix TaxID=216773 RepID=A0A7S1BAQ9_9STRA|mmetsp:Transcript_19805/g.44971  ORF Transcript_19805/g.44971 Transcript_19805/m.44971 type:complete len:235 (+) Transcript_19805:87-791(+)
MRKEYSPKNHGCYAIRLSIAFFFLLQTANALYVEPVTTSADRHALADLRFDEWIIEEGGNGDSFQSRQAFRMATTDIMEERKGAVAFLARTDDTNTPVGAAELSPIEVEDVVISCEDGNCKPPSILYVTDVLTSRDHRRKGVAMSLMEAVEAEAIVRSGSHLLLHVDPDNSAALKFYQQKKIGYKSPSSELMKQIDALKLAKSANTVGQILLSKVLPKPKKKRLKTAGKGFGRS